MREMKQGFEREILIYAFLCTLLVKLALAFVIPFTSDEAFFGLWGRFPAGGYYDHPPMVGWILAALMQVGTSTFWLRLPAVLFTPLIGLGIYLALKGRDRAKASLLAVLFLVSPINLLNVLITTDTPLIMAAFMSGFFLLKALERDSMPYYLLSGVFLGAAFLSKYFAVLLGLAYAVYFAVTPKTRRRTLGFALLLLAAAPFVVQNIVWNYGHCWTNIMFNLLNRNRAEHFAVGKILAFVAVQAYLITPPVLYYLYRRRAGLRERARAGGLGLMMAAFLVPLAVFAVLSLKKMVGLHWVLSFYPFMYVALFPLLERGELLQSIKFMTVFSFVHLLLIGTILALPVSLARNNKNYGMIIMGTRPEAVAAALKPYEGDFVFATPSYAASALLTHGYHYQRYFCVFGGGSYHGRQDDINTDFRTLDGRNILVLREKKPKPGEYERFFDRIEVKGITVSDARFCLVAGYGFRYPAYKEVVLAPIRDQFYRIPSFLPTGECYFLDRYFGGRLR